ncbi:MAG TPA: right-handed parallel beta-helix repeat-containing protein [Urbifossiella sp.]|nr:right-handed parallel beta-helix repeat-containing protein [Urbifossiella sp.]
MRTIAVAVFLMASAAPAAAAEPVLEIAKDTVLDPKRSYGKLVVTASNATIDGRGAWIIGAKDGNPKTFKGIGIEAKGVSGVTLKNVNVRGFETGLRIQDAKHWTVENCTFSDNFHDPEFGWGENGRRGGVLLVNVSLSAIKNCKANRVWDGCTLVHCDGNTLFNNDFSRCSNTCLKLWHSSRNAVKENKLDYGLRIKRGEVHARDSTSMLIETGSNDNTFTKNSCQHGGDGIFIRSLNNWVSSGNRFEKNDCSYANNNGFECWSPGNSFIGNTANHCSYGFWMGGSDRTVLANNTASFNGNPKGFHNSPHLPEKGHAGIVFMFGSATHITVRGNTCSNNIGAGIALIGDQGSKGARWKAKHWVIDSNHLTGNRWGVFAEYADWIDMGNNAFKSNGFDVFTGPGVTNLTRHKADAAIKSPPAVTVTGPQVVPVGVKASFDSGHSKDPLAFRWDLGDGTVATTAKVDHAFEKPGFYRVGVTASNGPLSSLGGCDVYVVDGGAEIGTEGNAGQWSWVDPRSAVTFADDRTVKLEGESSLRASIGPPYSGGRVDLRYTPSKAIDLGKKTRLSFWIKSRNPNIPAWQDGNPIVALSGPDGTLRIKPKRELNSEAADSEAREGWLLVSIPLAGDANWTAEGTLPKVVERMSLGFDSWGYEPFEVWLDGLRLE